MFRRIGKEVFEESDGKQEPVCPPLIHITNILSCFLFSYECSTPVLVVLTHYTVARVGFDSLPVYPVISPALFGGVCQSVLTAVARATRASTDAHLVDWGPRTFMFTQQETP